MKTLLRSLVLICCLSSCNSTFVAKSKNGNEVAYTGSFASKASKDHTEIHMASGASIVKDIENKNEVEAVNIIENISLAKAGIAAGTKTAGQVIGAVK